MLGYEVTRRHGAAGLPDDTIRLQFTGSAGQSFGAFVPRGITLTPRGRRERLRRQGAVGRQGRSSIRRGRRRSSPEENIIIGNVALYGATSGEAYIRGVAGERFARPQQRRARGGRGRRRPRLRVHDRRPRGRARTDRPELRGRHERRHRLRARCGGRLPAALQSRAGGPRAARATRGHRARAHRSIERHVEYTGSELGGAHPEPTGADAVAKFVKVMPRDYKRVLEAQARTAAARRDARRSSRLTGSRPMGKATGFLEIARAEAAGAAGRRAPARLARGLRAVSRRRAHGSGRALHGLRHSVLPSAAARSATSFRTGTIWCTANRWRTAIDRLHATNNFPEFTGRLCPAPCEGACVLGINNDPVTIKSIEVAIIDRAFDEGWVAAQAAGAGAPASASRSSGRARRASPPPIS